MQNKFNNLDYLPTFEYTDGYKLSHRPMYPLCLTEIYNNLTPRGSRIPEIDHVVVFGLQYYAKRYLLEDFNNNFFNKPKDEVVEQYKNTVDDYIDKDVISADCFAELHDLGYLPIHVKALPEGTLCPMRVPVMTTKNTHPNFAWLPNYLETLSSCVVWSPMTVATIANQFRKVYDRFAKETSDMPEFVDYQGHDFSMRGMSSVESACVCGMGHLTSFIGTDTIPAISYVNKYYSGDNGLIGRGCAASEHSVMSFGQNSLGEADVIKRLITEIFPSGIISVVCDTYDFWHTINVTIRDLKNVILARNGSSILRPDSGHPIKIVCGDPDSSDELERKGALRILYDIFGGTINSKGYIQLDPHIGLIYGDAITLERQLKMLTLMKEMGFASTNIVLGHGSYSYQYNTRDTFGFAIKATSAVVDGQRIALFKDPKTDVGSVKRSARGLLSVRRVGGKLTLLEDVSVADEWGSELRTIFVDGELGVQWSFKEVRERLSAERILFDEA